MSLQTEMQTQGNFLFRNRSYLPLIFLATGLAVSLYGEYYEVGGSDNVFEEYFEFICLGICLVGLMIRIKSVGHSGKYKGGTSSRRIKHFWFIFYSATSIIRWKLFYVVRYRHAYRKPMVYNRLYIIIHGLL